MKTKQKRDQKSVPQGGDRPEEHWTQEGKREYHIKLIEIAEIHIDGQMVRSEEDTDHIIELSNSISVHGLLEPIVVRTTDTGYQLIAGMHRLLACKRIGWTDIAANILPKTNTAPIKSLALIENIIRKDLSVKEECQAIEQLMNEEKLSPSQISDLLSRSRAWVDKRIMAVNLPTDLRDALFDNMIGLTVAEAIGEVDNEGIRKQILQQAIYQKLPVYTVRELVQLYKDAPLMEDAIQAGLETKRQISQATEPERHCDACGVKKKYSNLKAMFVCVDADECMDRVQESVKKETTTEA